jgi:drug/metabolite transporter (DMT)-like permease
LFEPRVIALTLTGALGYTLLIFSGAHLAPAAHLSILLPGLLPFAMTLCAWVVLGERPTLQRQVGIAVIAIGVAILACQVFRDGRATAVGDAMFVGACFLWALYTVLVRRWKISPWAVTINIAMVAALTYLPVYLAALPKTILSANLWEIALQAIYQGVIAAILQMVLYMRAVELLGPSRMGVLLALVPPLAAMAAVPALREPITPLLVLSLVMVSLGVWIGNAKPWIGSARPSQP